MPPSTSGPKTGEEFGLCPSSQRVFGKLWIGRNTCRSRTFLSEKKRKEKERLLKPRKTLNGRLILIGQGATKINWPEKRLNKDGSSLEQKNPLHSRSFGYASARARRRGGVNFRIRGFNGRRGGAEKAYATETPKPPGKGLLNHSPPKNMYLFGWSQRSSFKRRRKTTPSGNRFTTTWKTTKKVPIVVKALFRGKKK